MHPYVPGVLFGEFPLFQLECKCLFLVLFRWAHCEGLPALTNGPHSPEVPKWDRLWERENYIVCMCVCVCVCVLCVFGVPYYVHCVSMYVCICTYMYTYVHVTLTVYHCNAVTYCSLYRSSWALSVQYHLEVSSVGAVLERHVSLKAHVLVCALLKEPLNHLRSG